MCGSARPTVWNLHLSVADELAGEQGLGMSVLDEYVLYHLHHAKSRLPGAENHSTSLGTQLQRRPRAENGRNAERNHRKDEAKSGPQFGTERQTSFVMLPWRRASICNRDNS